MVEEAPNFVEEEPLNYDLRFDDFIEHLTSRPNFKYNYYQMWIREILVEWAAEIGTSDLFDPESAPDILPMWMNYIIEKLRSTQFEEFSKFCMSLQKDIYSFYLVHESEEWKCFRKEVVEKILQDESAENGDENVSIEDASQQTDEFVYEQGIDEQYQLFTDQFNYLIGLVEKALSTGFKYQVFKLAFGKKQQRVAKPIYAPYSLQFPKKYKPRIDTEIFKIAKTQSLDLMEHNHFLTASGEDSEEDDHRKTEEDLGSISQPISFIMPLSSAFNVNDEFWEAQKVQDGSDDVLKNTP